jgi:carboxyl-terminal processing protease
MANKVFRVVLLLLVLSFGCFAQQQQPQTKSLNIAPKTQRSYDIGDPFTLTKGSTFSASRPDGVAAGGNASATIGTVGARDSVAQIKGDVSEAMDIIRANYVSGKKANYAELNKSSIEAMLHVLDPHSNFFDQTEYQDLMTDQNSEYFGIGATIANYTLDEQMGTFVISTAPDSPAARAGLKFGDRILTVNGTKADGKDSFDVRERIRGPRGTTVRMTVERAATKRVETIELRRGIVAQPSIPDSYMLRSTVGYIDFSGGFNYTTADELSTALANLHAQGMTSLVLDIRDNPGGILDQAVRVAEKFLPPGQVVVSQRGRSDLDNRVFKSNGRKTENIPLVVLVNGNTASASEIVAGALQDYDRALIVGEQTFGKGLVQSVIDLPSGAGLTLTTARYFTPSGRSIQRDYSSAGLYDYMHHKDAPAPINSPVSYTLGGRKVFGGNGITPDEPIKTELMNEPKFRLLDPIFAFSREVVNGRIAGLESYRAARSLEINYRVKPVDFPVTDEVLRAFANFVAAHGSYAVLSGDITAEQKFITQRLRYNFISAAFGNITATQVLIESDSQVAKAVEALPRSRDLALTTAKKQ